MRDMTRPPEPPPTLRGGAGSTGVLGLRLDFATEALEQLHPSHCHEDGNDDGPEKFGHIVDPASHISGSVGEASGRSVSSLDRADHESGSNQSGTRDLAAIFANHIEVFHIDIPI